MASDPIDKLRRTAYPNPGRIGCLLPEIFESLRHRQLSFDDPAWEHLEHCSPCYSQFADDRDALFKKERHVEARIIGATAGGIAVLLMIGLGSFFVQRQRQIGAQQVATAAKNKPELTILNFEDDLRTRGVPSELNHEPAEAPVPSLPRSQGGFIVRLPRGSPAAIYDLEIADMGSIALWHFRGLGSLVNGITSVRVETDLRRLGVGQYRFRYRTGNEIWQERDIKVQ